MPTVVIGDNTGDDYSGTEDTELAEVDPTVNYGSVNNYQISKYGANDHRHVLLAFSGISSLPSSLSVSSAIVSIYPWLGGQLPNTINFKRLLRNWVESEATWNIYSTGNNWTTSGALSNGNDRASAVSDTLVYTSATGAYFDSVDGAQIQADVEDFADGTLSNYGWHLELDGTGNDGSYVNPDSSDSVDGERPYLTVIYTTGGGATALPFRMRY